MMMSTCHRQFRQVMPPFAIFLVTFMIAAKSTLAADGVPDRCIKCHTEAKIVEKVAKMPADGRAKKLEAFLTNHYTPDPVERAAIVAALKARAEKR